MHLAGIFLVVTVLFGSIHYESLLKSSANFLVLAIMGYAARCVSALKTVTRRLYVGCEKA